MSTWAARRLLRQVDVLALLNSLTPEAAAAAKVIPDAVTGAYEVLWPEAEADARAELHAAAMTSARSPAAPAT